MNRMIEVKSADLAGPALDWAVGKAEGLKPEGWKLHNGEFGYSPSTNWSQGGPLIESKALTIEPSGWDWKGVCVLWRAKQEEESVYFEHANLLVAAMRAVAHAKFGHAVSVPKELV